MSFSNYGPFQRHVFSGSRLHWFWQLIHNKQEQEFGNWIDRTKIDQVPKGIWSGETTLVLDWWSTKWMNSEDVRCDAGQWTQNVVAEQRNKVLWEFRHASLQQVQTAVQCRHLRRQVCALERRLHYLYNDLNHRRVLCTTHAQTFSTADVRSDKIMLNT